MAKDIFGTPQDDTWRGKNQAESYHGRDGNDRIAGLGGNDTLYGDLGNDTIDGGAGKDKIYGGYDSDVLHGGDNSDTLDGGAGKDKLYGDDGHDSLFGGSGNDTLSGGWGQDTLEGGSGADVFQLNNGDRVNIDNPNVDRIVDFEQGVDKIDLSMIDANTGIKGNQDFHYVQYQKGQTLNAGEVTSHYDVSSDTTVVQAAVDGDGLVDFGVDLKGDVPLTQSDFIM